MLSHDNRTGETTCAESCNYMIKQFCINRWDSVCFMQSVLIGVVFYSFVRKWQQEFIPSRKITYLANLFQWLRMGIGFSSALRNMTPKFSRKKVWALWDKESSMSNSKLKNMLNCFSDTVINHYNCGLLDCDAAWSQSRRTWSIASPLWKSQMWSLLWIYSSKINNQEFYLQVLEHTKSRDTTETWIVPFVGRR